mmetsp:Transcript_4368/g.12017  ORF Transcript_4368/g.12017 Transcript_4368/m.12017 type:complete len:304 (-) Transcript_4368:120-1031(-)
MSGRSPEVCEPDLARRGLPAVSGGAQESVASLPSAATEVRLRRPHGSMMHSSSSCRPPMQMAHSSCRACRKRSGPMATSGGASATHLPAAERTKPYISAPVRAQAVLARATSAPVMEGKTFGGLAPAAAPLPTAGLDPGRRCRSAARASISQRAAAAMMSATFCLPRCLWYHTGSGSLGSRATGEAPAASRTLATATLAASCSGVSMRRPLCLLLGSAPPSSSTLTASTEPLAAAACRAVVACTGLPLPLILCASTFGEVACSSSSRTSSAAPRPAAVTSVVSSLRRETAPIACTIVGPVPNA